MVAAMFLISLAHKGNSREMRQDKNNVNGYKQQRLGALYGKAPTDLLNGNKSPDDGVHWIAGGII